MRLNLAIRFTEKEIHSNKLQVGSSEGHFTHWKKRTRFFQNKRIYTDF